MDDLPNIALRAYQLWDAAGRPEGRSEEFYFAAEEELRHLIERMTTLESGKSNYAEADKDNARRPQQDKRGRRGSSEAVDEGA